MKPYYKEFGGFKIDTQGIYNAVCEFESSFNRALVAEFRGRLEDVLFDKRIVDVKFHPVNWRYHRDYYRRWMNKDWKDDAEVSVFYQDFFLHDSRSSGEVKFKSLTDDEKIQIVVPKRVSPINSFAAIFGITDEERVERERLEKEEANQEENFDNLTLERRNEILDNWKNSKYSDDFENDDNPYQYERWAYDIYSLYIPCDVEFSEEDREYFEFFFSWRLNLTDLYDVKLFLDWHLRNTFQDDGDSFKEFVRLLLMKYERVISNPYIINLTNEFLEQTKSNELNEPPKKLGRKPSMKIEIPKPVERKKDDKRTILSKEDTAKLFNYLAQLNCIFNNKSEISKASFAKGIEAFTGFSAGQLEDLLLYEEITHNTKSKKKEIVTKINELIIKGLEG